ncbi:calcium-binding protein [Methylomonas sp. MED-D]|uniref:calcium-binding protein n=1 Tax=unclassified Methylomonas TaxID=2608980 RepID=UPI0028A42D1D|nr:calcium-binding protein [Methylomonas sp. MV1]MDT4330221.1 calcium-binding protein [Methylomonas sp. MV1]
MGNDSYAGGAGNDTYIIEQSGDSYSESGGNGTDTVISYLSSHTLGANVEILRLAGNAVTGIGNALNNTITGNAGANTILGDVGDDIMDGGAGAGIDTLSNFENLTGSNLNDTLTGNAGNNVIIGGLGNDVMDGGAGTDTASYGGSSAGVTVNLGLTTA